MHRNDRRNATGTVVYDQVTTSVQNNWRKSLVVGKYGIEYSLASASDGPCPHGWGPTLKMELPHLRFSALTTAKGRGMGRECPLPQPTKGYRSSPSMVWGSGRSAPAKKNDNVPFLPWNMASVLTSKCNTKNETSHIKLRFRQAYDLPTVSSCNPEKNF